MQLHLTANLFHSKLQTRNDMALYLIQFPAIKTCKFNNAMNSVFP
jgi:hypothetical protein